MRKRAHPRPRCSARARADQAALRPTDPVTGLQQVMTLLGDRIEDILPELPAQHQEFVANALLNLAVEQVIDDVGAEAAAGILARLAQLVADGRRPAGGEALALSRHDA
jgi:hypothetical protein